MATIDSKKLLPPSKAFSSRLKNKKVLIPASSVRVKKNVKAPSEELKSESSSGISSDSLLGIKNIISKIQGVLLKSSIFQKKEQDNKRKGREKEDRKKRESKLEKKPTNKNITSGIASLPSLSFIDRIKKFLFWTILGRFFSDLFPKLIEFSKMILPAVNFIANFAGNILKGVVDFIEWGYIAYDKVRDLSKEIGGENAQKVFDDFSKHFNTFINLALIAAMAGSSIGGGGGDKPGKPGKPGAPGQSGGGKPTAAERAKNARIRDIQRKYGPNARKIYENALNNGKTPSQAEAAMQKGLKRGISIRPGADSLSAKTAKAGSIFKGGFRGLKKAPARLATKMLGKAGVKIAGKVFGRIPIIGGLIDFAFALWSGEKPGRAAAKAVGATIGSALGTFIPIPFAGTILGGILGDIVGGALYDTLVAGNNKKTQAKAKGGNIGKTKVKSGGNTKRTIKITPKKPKRIEPQRTSIGRDIGGKRKIEEIYGKPELGKKSPLRALVKTSNDLKQIKSLNGLPAAMFSAGVDMTLGQKPNKDLPIQIGNTFGSIVESSINAELSSLFGQISKTLTLAEGGSITATRTLDEGGVNDIGRKIGGRIASILSIALNSSATKIFNNLNQEFNLREGGDGAGGDPNLDGGGGGPDVFHGMGAERMWNFFKNKGLSDFAVAGIMGNARWESSFNPTARGKGMGPGGSDAIGIFQWGETERWKTLVNWAKQQNLNPWDYDTQLKFAWHEMQTSEKATIPAIQGATSASDAAEKFRSVYERSESTEQRRKDAAEGFYQQYKGKTYIPPTTGVPLIETSQFGPRGGGYHYGIDLQNKAGWQKTTHLPVTIKKGGVVEYAGISGDGNGIVIIRHDDGSKTRYIHLNNFKVRNGQTVGPGTIIGRIAGEGESGYGNSQGPHLHFEYITPQGKTIDPRNIYSQYVALGANVVQSNRPLSQPAPAQQPPRQPNQPPTATPSPTGNKGVVYDPATGKFIKKGGGFLGTNQEISVTDRSNTYLRSTVKEFGLGSGTKEGQKKQAADGNYYEWKNGRWVLWNPAGPGANASLPVSNLSQSIAQVGGVYTDNLLMQREIIIIDRTA